MAPRKPKEPKMSDIKGIRVALKDRAQQSSEGFEAEFDLFQEFDAQQIPHNRALEQAGVDGVLEDPRISDWAPELERHPGHAWRRVMQKPTDGSPPRYMTFDVKYFSLLTSGTKGQPYAFLSPPWDVHPDKAEADVFYMLFQSEPRWVAIVPKSTFVASVELPHGLQALINNVPAWCYPFMVHFDDLKAAVSGLFEAVSSDGPHYRNPTTNVRFCGWRPTLSETAPIWPVNPRLRTSLDTIMKLWDRLEELGVICRLNPIQPFFCDFLLALSGLPEDLRIEHKILGDQFATGRGSPFAFGRQWHFCICERKGEIICYARHHVKDAWEDCSDFKEIEAAVPFRAANDAAGLKKMVEYIEKEALTAIDAVHGIRRSTPARSLDLEVLLSSNSTRIGEVDKQKVRDQAPKGVWHDIGLPEYTLALNAQFMERGTPAFAFQLDNTSPLGDKLIVPDLAHGDQQKHSFGKGVMPYRAYDRGMSERKCLVLRSADLSAGAKATNAYPLYMRERYWCLPPDHPSRAFLFGALTAEQEQYCMLLPSSFTRMHSFGVKDKIPEDTHDRARLYFDKTHNLKHHALPSPTFGSDATEVKKFRRGGDFMEDPDVNPLRYIFNFDSREICDVLVDLLQSEGMTSIDARQSNRSNKEFDMAPYWTTVGEALQAMWDFGLRRTPAKDSTEQIE